MKLPKNLVDNWKLHVFVIFAIMLENAGKDTDYYSQDTFIGLFCDLKSNFATCTEVYARKQYISQFHSVSPRIRISVNQ